MASGATLSQPIDHPWLSLEWSWDVCRAGHTFMLYVIGLINHFVRLEDNYHYGTLVAIYTDMEIQPSI